MISIFYFLILIFSVIIHEVSHGLAAKAQGDDTAEYAGRLTLNPVRHLDPIGSILLPAFLFLTRSPIIFGWAKPVPFNPLALRNQRWGPALVAIAGPFSNIFLALLLSVAFRGFLASGNFSVLPFLAAAIYLNIVLAIFNLVPIPPLDGSRILTALLPRELQGWSYALEAYGLFLVILFIVFGIGLIQPIFPLLLKLFAGPEAIFALSRFLQLL